MVLSVLSRQPAQCVYVGDRHQQIYEWRGAVNAMETIQTDDERYIRRSFRFGSTIAEAATLILRTLEEPQSILGNDKVVSSIASVGDARAVLARTNTKVIAEALATLQANRKPHIVGGTDELRQLVSDVFELQKGKPGSHPDFFGFTNWDDVVAFSESEEGEALRAFVSLVLQHGPGALWHCIKESEAEEADADIIISTAHKAKGREWMSVRIADDFSAPVSDDGEVAKEEVRLFYVAITRAKERLVVDAQLLSAFQGG